MRSYLANVASAITGREGFKGTAQEETVLYSYSMMVVMIYLLVTIAFGVGAAVLSYRYNVAAGTGSILTVGYVISAFMFSYFYYPYHALILTGNGLKQKGGAKR